MALGEIRIADRRVLIEYSQHPGTHHIGYRTEHQDQAERQDPFLFPGKDLLHSSVSFFTTDCAEVFSLQAYFSAASSP